MDRAKQSIRRSVALEADGIPLGFATAPANRHDSYFYGLRVHLVSTASGEPVEFTLAAASEADISLFKELKLRLPERAIIHADKGYTDYHYEDLLEDVGLHLVLRTTIDSSFSGRWRGDSTLAVPCVVGARWEHKVGGYSPECVEGVFSALETTELLLGLNKSEGHLLILKA